jgi:hypothetical protein
MNITTHTADIRKRNPRPYRAHMLHLLAYAHADESGVWEPVTKVSLRRALAHEDQPDGEAREAEVTTALTHCIAQGLLRPDSTESRLILSGSTTTTTTEEKN